MKAQAYLPGTKQRTRYNSTLQPDLWALLFVSCTGEDVRKRRVSQTSVAAGSERATARNRNFLFKCSRWSYKLFS